MDTEKALIANLIRVAKADGELDEQEVLLIYNLAHKKGLSKDDLEQLIVNLEQHSANTPEGEAEKIKFFYHLLNMSVVDLDVKEVELELLKSIGEQMGLDADKVSKAIGFVQENLETDLSPEQLEGLLG